jgi:16S rRNA (cytosine1402-N4)-methyltransferase
MTDIAKHVPVLMKETVSALHVVPGGRYIDGTLGRAGHTREIIAKGGEVLGIDRDEQAIAEVRSMEIPGLTVVKGNHGDIAEIANSIGWSAVDGVLLDLGVSSPQLDEADRGFSFLRDGPLDMRMDRSCGASAADIVNGADAERLEEIFREWGEEPQSRRIARAIVKARESGTRFDTTLQLADFVESIVGRHGGHHPATRIFQALRMEVNDEMGELRRALSGALSILRPGGRFAVITFESLTDREVKRFFAAHAGREESLQQGGSEWRGEMPKVRLVARKAVVASDLEISQNPRSRSAKLRIVEKE